MNQEKRIFINSIKIPLLFIVIIWSIKIFEVLFSINLTALGILPRQATGLIGIITFPLLHSDWKHLMSNTLPLLFLGIGTFYFYPTISRKIMFPIYLIPGLLVWLFARMATHIGASSIIYGLASFLFFSGIIRRDTRSATLALLVTFLYGGLIWGVLPLENHVSWEGHLFGAITGFISAVFFRKADPYKKYDWEDEPDSDADTKPKISYDNSEFY